jgi:hypothetical protein
MDYGKSGKSGVWRFTLRELPPNLSKQDGHLGWAYHMETRRALGRAYHMSLPHSASHPTIPPLTAQKLFASWPFDFEFLIWKAYCELELSMKAVDEKTFLLHSFNFAVTIHAIADHVYHSGAKRNWPQQEEYFAWIKSKQPFGDCIGIFIDISNTYKHSDRDRPNRFIDYFELMQFPDDWVESCTPDDLRNRIVYDTGASLWPVLTAPGERAIYYHYAAEGALSWWLQNHSVLLV